MRYPAAARCSAYKIRLTEERSAGYEGKLGLQRACRLPRGRGADFLASVFYVRHLVRRVGMRCRRARRDGFFRRSRSHHSGQFAAPRRDGNRLRRCRAGTVRRHAFREERYLRDRKLAVYERGNFRYPEPNTQRNVAQKVTSGAQYANGCANMRKCARCARRWTRYA